MSGNWGKQAKTHVYMYMKATKAYLHVHHTILLFSSISSFVQIDGVQTDGQT